MAIKKVGVLTSGGDSPGMNAAIRAVVRACVYYGVVPVLIYEGYKGLRENKLKVGNARSVANIINQGGTFLKSSRCPKFYTKEGREEAYKNVVAAGIEGLIVIGGDGSFAGAMLFEEEHGLPCIGIPGTIDNDIYGTDHTIGYDTARNTVANAIDKIRDTATSHNRLFFIEVMGRDAGFIALSAGVACGAEAIMIPEDEVNVDELINSLRNSGRGGKSSSIIVVAEGDKSGGVFELARKVESTCPEYEAKVTVLGHIQRGGVPTCADRVLASRLGVFAVESMLDGKHLVMVGIRDRQVVCTPLERAVSKKNNIDPYLMKVAEIVSI